MRYRTKAKRELAYQNAVRRGKRSGEVRRAKMLSNGPQDQEPRRRDPGAWIGELQWRDESGQVRRWTVIQGRRKNQIVVDGKARGWDATLALLRRHLAIFTR